MSIFGQLWDHWTLEFKILTPVLHVLFTLAQLWGSIVFWRMAQKHRKLSREQDGEMQQSMPAPMMMYNGQEHVVEETHKFNAKGEQIV